MEKKIIVNPLWDWDEEALCVSLGIDYDTPYWIEEDDFNEKTDASD